jgi:phosphopantothenoylcysteine decarboxylase/phosphopantothenate--cysteine ligase
MRAINTEFPERLLLGVCGGIAAYKSPDLVRRLTERGAEVRVVMTRAARSFVSPVTFQAVSGQRVRVDLWDEEAEAAMGHIELARWADLVLVAPATAHFIGAFAAGLAADLLSTVCLATEAPVAMAPSMNRAMWAHPAVQENVARLARRGVRVLGPGEGDQACGELGEGRMLEPLEIVALLSAATAGRLRGKLTGVRTVITAGPTREPIDPVRYITNRSSGKMGYAIARAAAAAGAEVVLVSGPVTLPTPPGVRRIDVQTAQEMFDSVQGQIDGTDLFIACAAVSDYRPNSVSEKKIKRSRDQRKLELVPSPDTLASVAAIEDGPFTVGFAAETDDVEKHALEKLERKGLDMIAANRVGPQCGFDKETNELSVFWTGGGVELGERSKSELAERLIELIAERMEASVSNLEATNAS